MYSKRGFTLIELLVVIAIIGILSVMVVTQLGGARVKARNSTAKSDVSEMGKAIETFKNSNDEKILAQANQTLTTGSDTLVDSTSTNFTSMFRATGTTYPVLINKTASADYTYTYKTTVKSAAANTHDLLTGGYLIYSNLVAEGSNNASFTAVSNGSSSTGLIADVPAAAVAPSL